MPNTNFSSWASFMRWIKKSWEPIAKIVGLASAIAIGGFKVGAFYQENKFILEQIRIEQACNEKVNKLETDLTKEKLEEDKKTVESLTQALKNIQQANHAK